MRAEQGAMPERLEELPRFKLLRGVSVHDGRGRQRLVMVPMTEYVGADALRTVRALCAPGAPARDADGSLPARKHAIP